MFNFWNTIKKEENKNGSLGSKSTNVGTSFADSDTSITPNPLRNSAGLAHSQKTTSETELESRGYARDKFSKTVRILQE